VVFIASGFFVSTAFASTSLDTPDITADTTWTTDGSPYLINGDVKVEAGVTLTVNPGVIVKFNGSSFNVFGTLQALGTEANPIYLTSYYDDTIGGDTDNQLKKQCTDVLDADGNPTGAQNCVDVPVLPTSNDWNGIQIVYSTIDSHSILNNVTEKYSNGGLTISTNSGAVSSTNFTSSQGVTINKSKNNTFAGLKATGIYIDSNSNASITDSDIYLPQKYEVIEVCINSSLKLTNTKVDGVGNLYGLPFINVCQNSTASFDGVNVTGNNTTDSTISADQNSILNIKNSNITSGNNAIEILSGSALNITDTPIQCNNTGINVDSSSLSLSGGSVTCDNIGIKVSNNSKADVSGTKVTGATSGNGTMLTGVGLIIDGNDISSGVVTISKSEISGNNKGLVVNDTNIIANQNSIHDNTYYGVYNYDIFSPSLYSYDFTNNYWGDPSGPKETTRNPNGLGNKIAAYGGTDTNTIFQPFLPSDPLVAVKPTCCSSVLFLPGVEGSRLYEQEGIEDKELWVSTNDALQEDLVLNNQGKSVNNIYTKNDTQRLSNNEDETGIVDKISFLNLNIYESFINDLEKWKDSEKIIKDYAFIPYDWRLSLDDIINNGKIIPINNISYNQTQDFSESFILQKLQELQSNSLNGKVTIIAHSNGGLVAKALIQKLKDTNNPLYEKIDKVIFVAVPQIGTPEAFINLLHGTEIGPYGMYISSEMSRYLSENMPAAYNLLPSSAYFTTVDPAYAADKLASFENKSFFDPQTSKYGVYISNEAEMKSFLLGGDGRTKPAFSDSVHPNIGNQTLYDQAQNVHQMLDNWTPYKDTKVIQVAGWGEETLSGLDYKSYVDFWGKENLSYKPREVIDGDGTVVVPSALWMSDSNPNVERWWVDLKTYNKDNFPDRTHKDIFEVPNILNFVKSNITDTSFTDPEKIVVNNTSSLVSSDINRFHYTLHSPLTLGVTDSQGRYTGMDPITKQIKEEIPGVNYRKIGDVQFISIPDDLSYKVKMQGYEAGSFALDIEKQKGNEILESSSLQGIPSTVSTIATIAVAPGMPVSDSILSIDQNGDGKIDKTLQAKDGEVVTYDVVPPELKVTFDKDIKDVIFSALDLIDKNPTVNITKDSISLKDVAGNTTIIPFIKYRDNPTKLRFVYNKIIRNGIITNVPNTSIMYDWKEKNGILTDLDTTVTVRGEEKYIFSYNKVRQVTTIKEKVNKNIKTTQKEGFVLVKVETKGSELEVNY